MVFKVLGHNFKNDRLAQFVCAEQKYRIINSHEVPSKNIGPGSYNSGANSTCRNKNMHEKHSYSVTKSAVPLYWILRGLLTASITT
jgi:hypothetical protein